MAYSKEIKERIESYLNENDYNYSFDEESGYFKFGMRLHNKLKRCDVYIAVDQKYYVTHSILQINADNDCIKEVGEYLHRANYGLNWCSFELDYDDGEIRIKCFVN